MTEIILIALVLLAITLITGNSIILSRQNEIAEEARRHRIRLELKMDRLRAILETLPEYDRPTNKPDRLDPLGQLSGKDFFNAALRDYDALGGLR
jgi:hypothetical protein